MDTYQVTGGLRIGQSYWIALNYTYPLVSLTATAEELTVKYLFSFRRLARRNIVSVTEYKVFLSRGVRIVHADRDEMEKVPPFFVFWTRRADEVLEALATLGYPVNSVGGSHSDL